MAYSLQDQDVVIAEIIWCFNVAVNNFSFRSCEGMFDCPAAAKFNMSRSKVSYMLTDSLGPYFKNELIADVNNARSPFTLHFDETTNSQVKKQLDLHIRYWSPTKNQVVVRFYKALMFGHSFGKDVGEKNYEIFEG